MGKAGWRFPVNRLVYSGVWGTCMLTRIGSVCSATLYIQIVFRYIP